jgi:metal-responsive CopG/Arc/MetJ family transcriptional regulator
MSTVSVEIPDELSHSLDELAQSAKMSRSEYILSLLLKRLSHLEQLKIAEERMAERIGNK